MNHPGCPYLFGFFVFERPHPQEGKEKKTEKRKKRKRKRGALASTSPSPPLLSPLRLLFLPPPPPGEQRRPSLYGQLFFDPHPPMESLCRPPEQPTIACTQSRHTSAPCYRDQGGPPGPLGTPGMLDGHPPSSRRGNPHPTTPRRACSRPGPSPPWKKPNGNQTSCRDPCLRRR